MGWSPKSATNAYLDTLKLCKDDKEIKNDQPKSIEPESNEFLSALAAGTSAQLIVEVSTEASNSTIALAAAARQTGGRLVCILPEADALEESKEVIKESGLNDMVEFRVGDPYKLLPKYENIDFSLVDCKTEANAGLLRLLDVNPRRAVVVAKNLVGRREGFCGDIRGLKVKGAVRSMKHPLGNGMEVTMIGETKEFGKVDRKVGWKERKAKGSLKRRPHRSRWVMKVDEESGEEHIFRVFQSQ
uniref:Carboxylate-amine ligase Rxyl_1127 n=1 Tax=Anthurium amnicola TaxID=1678845 RepID=A0A1D1ZEE3_9ARAE